MVLREIDCGKLHFHKDIDSRVTSDSQIFTGHNSFKPSPSKNEAWLQSSVLNLAAKSVNYEITLVSENGNCKGLLYAHFSVIFRGLSSVNLRSR